MARILMVAAENGALPGGKVGGIGDVVREVPVALAQRKCEVAVVTPAYAVFDKLDGAERLQTIKVRFGGGFELLELFHVKGIGDPGVEQYVVEHPLFSSCGAGRIYCDDPPGQPFKSDASKFALFCSAVAEAVTRGHFGKLDALHLHDWHAAFLLILRRYDPAYRGLQALRCAYSIHNLAIQGIRPFARDYSSLESWYPDLVYERAQLADPQWSDCVNPMASAIRLADAVHTVSPSYAEEILRPSDPDGSFHGGEGLDPDLRRAREQGRLFGILNGCEYPKKRSVAISNWPSLRQRIKELILLWASREPVLRSMHFIAHGSLDRLTTSRPSMLITSVGRVTEQKVGLLRQATGTGQPALHGVLDALGRGGLFIMVGSGDPEYEQFLTETSVRYRNFIFLGGYSDELADALYQQGDLFLMPSSFEPCGISQMLALRAGQPCLVHHVGGLRDTVEADRTGFAFTGDTRTEQADALVAAAQRALGLYQKKSKQWQSMRKSARAARFEWTDSIDAYLKQLYQIS